MNLLALAGRQHSCTWMRHEYISRWMELLFQCQGAEVFVKKLSISQYQVFFLQKWDQKPLKRQVWQNTSQEDEYHLLNILFFKIKKNSKHLNACIGACICTRLKFTMYSLCRCIESFPHTESLYPVKSLHSPPDGLWCFFCPSLLSQ